MATDDQRNAKQRTYRPDDSLENADWPKRTNDRFKYEYDKAGRIKKATPVVSGRKKK